MATGLNRMDRLLNRIDRLIKTDPKRHSLPKLRSQLKSTSRDTRLATLMRIRHQIKTSGLRQGYFDLVQPLTVDTDSRCRWQATIIVGEFIEHEPDRVWRVARQLGMSPKSDVRAAAATVLLEHLLQYHPKTMVPRLRQELRRGNKRFADALGSCWNFGRGVNKQKIQKLLDEVGTRRRELPSS